MKKERQAKIKELIGKRKITTQEDLILALEEKGFSTTQATVSRDIREMKLVKISDNDGGYYYSMPENDAILINKLNHSLALLIESVDVAMNIIVIRTRAGMAQAVATGIDNIKIEEILGCVAGDDTILVIAKDQGNAEQLSEKIRTMIAEA